MNSNLLKSLFILMFFAFSRIYNVRSDWAWNEKNVVCLKARFDTYVAGMENIFSPNNQLGRMSFVLQMKGIQLRSILEVGNFNDIIGDIVDRCREHLNHDYVTSVEKSVKKAKSVLLTLCNSIRKKCPGVSDPMPFSGKLYKTYSNVLKGTDENFKKYCGEPVEDLTPRDSFVKEEKPISTSGASSSSRFGKFFRRFSSRAEESGEDES